MAIAGLLYDAFMAPLGWLGLSRARRRLVDGVRGRTLEIGTGTGLSLGHYAPASPDVAIDLDRAGLLRARSRGRSTLLIQANAQVLPFATAAFDTVVCCLVLCTVRKPDVGLAEIRRVLRPGGELRLLEHVRPPGALLGRLAHFLTPAWKRVAAGCHLDRDTLGVVEAAGFRIIRRQSRWRGAFEEVVAIAP